MVDRFEILKNKIEELATYLQKKGYDDSTDDIVNDLIDIINSELEGR